MTSHALNTPCPVCRAPCDWRGVCPRCVLVGALAGLANPADPDPARKLGSYTLVDLLGSGGMGRVWRAQQEGLGREIALKTLRAGTLADDAARERFRREAHAAARLRHPGIVTVHEVGETNGELFLTMELVRGETLAQRLRSGPLSARNAAEIVRSLADAVHHAHTHGVIHRDLKPSNVLLDAERLDVPRLTDFGVAMLADSSAETLTSTLEGIGTLAYLAPEQASGGRTRQGPPTDVYGLGAVLYHCLTGRPPFVGDYPAAVLRAVVESRPPAPRAIDPNIPRDLETVCLKCLEYDPSGRYSSAAELRDELDRFLQGEPVRARPLSLAARMWRQGRRRPAIAALSGATVLLVIALTVALNRAALPIRRAPTPLANLLTNWPVRPAELLGATPLKSGGCSALLVSPCGRWVAAGDQVGAVRVIRSDNFAIQASLQLDGTIRVMDWSQDGEWLLVGTQTGHWCLWEHSRSKEPKAQGKVLAMVDAAALRPDGQRHFLGSYSAGEFWQNSSSGASLIYSNSVPANVLGARFNATGDRLFVVCTGNIFLLLDGDSGQVIQRLNSESSLNCLFTLTGTELALIRDRQPGVQELEFFRAQDGLPSGRVIRSDRGIGSFCFSSDGGRVFIANRANRIDIFDAATGKLLASPIQLAATLWRWGFSPDGLRLFTNTSDERSHVWEIHSGAPLVGPLVSPWLPWATTLSADGGAIVRPDPNAQVSFWNARPIVPDGWAKAAEVSRALLKLGTPDGLRMAAALQPDDPAILGRLAAVVGRGGAPAELREAEFLRGRANQMEGGRRLPRFAQ
ncbi:MAG TPA: WD40 repeat domain-containing serine/threonine protein kinase [Verrucomicrobiota bacterium]|nr:WD40 repeat domain-containing serine/threonine protein kinase [Verrucomicrobiota bacterium]